MGFCFVFFCKISASLPVKKLCSSVPACSFPNLHCCLAHAGTGFFAVTGEAGWRNRFGWKILLFFFPSVSCQLLPFPGLMYHLVIQALGAREWPWSLLIPMARPAVQELRNLSQGGEISISRWQIRAPQLLPYGHQLSSLKLEGKNPCLCTQKACQGAQGEAKWLSPPRTRKALGQH